MVVFYLQELLIPMLGVTKRKILKEAQLSILKWFAEVMVRIG